MSKYAIGTYEINLLKEEDLNYTFDCLQSVCEYVDTAINYDNDFLLEKVLKPETKIISKISSCHYKDYDFFVDNHLKSLGRDSIEMMLIHSDRGSWKQLAERLIKDDRFVHKGVSNFSKEDLIKYKEITGEWPYANEIEINPYYKDVETVSFCRENGIKIIAYAILSGKYNSWREVANFGLGNLISYAKKFADIVIVRANSITEANNFKHIIENFDFTKYEPVRISVCDFSKSISPMNYQMPSIKYNTIFGKPTYLREWSLNGDVECKSSKVVDIELPKFEMLGDYKTYIRYKYGSNQYFGDWLKIGDNKYVAVHLWKDDALTKVYSDGVKVEVTEYEF